ncbi:MAG: T9SS type A sorting domain-containing protein [Bacteroidales bacterium]|nr:T9SS type A sorting domain-containing protein [Bacteroidales bacterium]
MKKLLIISVIFFVSFSVRSQVPAMSWEFIYENENKMGRDIAHTLDSCYIVTATNSDFDYGLTLKLDTAGNVIWSCPYGGRTVTSLSDSNYIIAGGLNYNAAFLRKIDADGNSLWQKTYGASGQDNFKFVIETADSNLLAGGYSHSPLKSGYLVKTDLEGNLIWERRFVSQEYATTTDVVEWEGYFYVVGRFEDYNYEYALFAARVDQTGNLDWYNTYEGGPYDYSVLIGEDEKLFVAGGTHITKINPNGEQVWSKYLSEPVRIFLIQPTADNKYIAAGRKHYGSGWYSAPLMAKLDTAGNLIWSKTWYGPELSGDCFESILVARDHGYVGCGYSDYGSSDYKIRVIKTDPDPDVITGFDAEDTSDNDLVICPNPTDGRFTIDGGTFDHIAVYHISGKKILETYGPDPIINLVDYPAGLYFVRTKSDGKTLTGKVILK